MYVTTAWPHATITVYHGLQLVAKYQILSTILSILGIFPSSFSFTLEISLKCNQLNLLSAVTQWFAWSFNVVQTWLTMSSWEQVSQGFSVQANPPLSCGFLLSHWISYFSLVFPVVSLLVLTTACMEELVHHLGDAHHSPLLRFYDF